MNKVLIVTANFYEDIADALCTGATEYLKQHGIDFDVETVPGALEIPPAISIASDYALYDGYIALGCVIRGETTHYDYVAGESASALMGLGLEGLAIGNGILTVENKEQAMVRAKDKNKGASAAEACLALMKLRDEWEVEAEVNAL